MLNGEGTLIVIRLNGAAVGIDVGIPDGLLEDKDDEGATIIEGNNEGGEEEEEFGFKEEGRSEG